MELSPPAATSAEQTGLNAASPPQQSATASRGQTPNHFHRAKHATKCRSSHNANGNGNRGNGIKRSKAASAANNTTASDAADGDIASKTAKDLILTAASLILKQTNSNGHCSAPSANANVQNQLTSLIAQTLQNICERSHGQQHHSCSCSAANNGVSSFEQLLAATSPPPMTLTVSPVNKIVYLFEQFVGRKIECCPVCVSMCE